MQVILNILNNAKDAIIQTKKEGGLIKITTRCRTNACVTTIEDNGGGIEKQVIEKIFDPYFTTKAPDKGTGIGLYMAKTIIEKHMEGTINVTNTENGALFSIMLPRTK
jgi:signal transduction histidine kinase